MVDLVLADRAIWILKLVFLPVYHPQYPSSYGAVDSYNCSPVR